MFSNSTSDETVLRLRRKWEVSERVLEPLDLSADEMLDFIAQECYGVNYEGGGWKISLGFNDSAKVYVMPLRKAIAQAAAYCKEENGDF